MSKHKMSPLIRFLITNKVIKKEKNAKLAVFCFIVLSISFSALLINSSITVHPAILDQKLITVNNK